MTTRDLTAEQNDVLAEVALDIDERLAAEDAADATPLADPQPA